MTVAMRESYMDGRTGSAGSRSVLTSPLVLPPAYQRDRSRSYRHILKTVKSDSSEVHAGSLLFLGLFVLAAALIMLMA